MDGHTETIRSQQIDNCKNQITYAMKLTCKAKVDASGHPDSLNETGITVLFTVCIIIIIIITIIIIIIIIVIVVVIIIFILFHKSYHEDVEMVT
jgi:Flp pilus assembly protein TadB